MAIFGKSKKDKQTTSQPQFPSNIFTPQPTTPQYGGTSQPNRTYIQQPASSNSYYSPQSQGWVIAPVPSQYQPASIPQHIPRLPPERQNTCTVSKLALASVSNLVASDVAEHLPGAQYFNNGTAPLQIQGTQHLNQGAQLCDLISSKFNTIITLIDEERFSGDERELAVAPPTTLLWQQQQQEPEYASRTLPKGKSKEIANNPVPSATLKSTNYFAKVNLYANSRLPPSLPPMKL